MKNNVFSFLIKLCLVSSFITSSLRLSAEELPSRLQVALMSKIVAMELKLAKKQEITIFVLNAERIFELLNANVGFQIGNSILLKVDKGSELPKEKYDVIYIGSFSQEQLALDYSSENNALSLYPMGAGLENKGSLGLGIKSGKPMFLLNLNQSETEDLHWNSTILKVAQLQ
jgi:hypothetical protein